MLADEKPAVALPQLRAAVRERPADPRAHFELGRCQLRLADYEAAITSLREALRLRNDWPEARIQLAWLLATTPHDRLRNGVEATRLAEAGLKAAQQRAPVFSKRWPPRTQKRGISTAPLTCNDKPSNRPRQSVTSNCEANSKRGWSFTLRKSPTARRQKKQADRKNKVRDSTTDKSRPGLTDAKSVEEFRRMTGHPPSDTATVRNQLIEAGGSWRRRARESAATFSLATVVLFANIFSVMAQDPDPPAPAAENLEALRKMNTEALQSARARWRQANNSRMRLPFISR